MIRKKQQFISVVLIICIILTGICFDNIEMDCFDAFKNNTTSSPNVWADDECVLDIDACTAEMLGTRNTVLSQQVAFKSLNNIKYSRLLYSLFVGNSYVQNLSSFNATSKLVSLRSETNFAVILSFIHDKDGKKDIRI